jgi:hypothetical protein
MNTTTQGDRLICGTHGKTRIGSQWIRFSLALAGNTSVDSCSSPARPSTQASFSVPPPAKAEAHYLPPLHALAD